MEPTHSSHASFFEKYQTFFAIIICGALIAGGIVVAKFVAPQNQSAEPVAQTQASVRADMIKAASKVGVNKSAFAACLDNGKYTQAINDDITLAAQSGVTGTPTFFIIKRTFGPNDAIIKQEQVPVLGARDLATFEKAIADMKAPDGQPEIKGAKIELSADEPWFGPRRASVVIVEYSDIDCPFCKAAKPVVDELLAKHPDYAFVYRHAPIASLHPYAPYKAEASECVRELGGDAAFYKFLDQVVK